MLKGIPKILHGDLLKILWDMGHGDWLAIVDANYPAVAMGKRVIEMPGVHAVQMLKAVMPLFPVDHITREPALVMAVEPEDLAAGFGEPEIFAEFEKSLSRGSGRDIAVGRCSREAFYEKSRGAFVVIHTGEERLYGNLLVCKGVVEGDGWV